MACIFCEILAGRIPGLPIWEDRHHVLMLDIRPIAPAHALLIPKRHSEDLFVLPDTEYARILRTARKVAPVLRRATGAKRIGMVVEGFGVPHLHLHLVPVSEAGELNPERAKDMDMETLRAIQKKLKLRFNRLK
ncbi:MAG TPA: HIT family protein [Candidatus Polarisedimenticolia bacterium]|nr:HIT family protein [Candidatus Polarisedimenticolia bacterium]